MTKMWQTWRVRMYWKIGRSLYERGRTSCWPVGITAMQVLEDVARDPSNGCDLAICTAIEVEQVGEPCEIEPAGGAV